MAERLSTPRPVNSATAIIAAGGSLSRDIYVQKGGLVSAESYDAGRSAGSMNVCVLGCRAFHRGRN